MRDLHSYHFLHSRLLGREFPDVLLFTKEPIAFGFRDDYHAQARQPSYQASLDETADRRHGMTDIVGRVGKLKGSALIKRDRVHSAIPKL